MKNTIKRIDFIIPGFKHKFITKNNNRGFAVSCWDKYFERTKLNLPSSKSLDLIFYNENDDSIKFEECIILSNIIFKLKDIVSYTCIKKKKEKTTLFYYNFKFKSLMARMFFMRIIRAYMAKDGEKFLNKCLEYNSQSRKNIYQCIFIVSSYYEIIEGCLFKYKYISNNYKIVLPSVVCNTYLFFLQKSKLNLSYKETSKHFLRYYSSNSINLYYMNNKTKKQWIDAINSNACYHLHDIRESHTLTYYTRITVSSKRNIGTVLFIKEYLLFQEKYFNIFKKMKSVKKHDFKAFNKNVIKFEKLLKEYNII